VTSTIEDYLKRIMAETEKTGRQVVGLGRLALLSDVTPGTVTTMMKSLADSGLVDYLPRQGVRLTSKGKKSALNMLRRHRLIESFLVEILGFDWSEVHREAEVLEHAVSDRIVDRIDEILDHPISDPHGDPIPGENGATQRTNSGKLSEKSGTESLRITRIADDDPQFLSFLKREGLVPGRRIDIEDRNDDAGTIQIRTDKKTVTISLRVADNIYVDAV
jgi:DtxR family transcriptional regulator, Mn-dependent transcriptional regulator